MRLRAPVAVALAATLLTGCAQSVDPIERLGKKAAQRVHQHGPTHEQPYRHWGLTAPLAPAPKPASRPAARSAGPGLPPVVDHVRTHDKVVFLTHDDDHDPNLADLIRELRLPVTVFRTRPTLTGRPYTAQRTRICATRARLLRPAAYDLTTRRAAADCGVSALVLWRASTTTGTLTYTRGDHHLTPGDIVQVDRAVTTARLLRTIQGQGLTVGNLEDYL
ncbi:hypothetical protein [Streptomyces sp. NPDC051576]|uniref:hypothetical protein n=1 Tax=Streptomyces sp. NPDC051576 TaxID=3155803 RepID=UPI00343FE548